MTSALLWLRRDLRLADHPALGEALSRAPGVHAVFVVDPVLWDRAGRVPKAWVAANVLALSERLDGRLLLRVGDPSHVVPDLAADLGAATVHVSAETTPYGARRDADVGKALVAQRRELRQVGSPYAVGPGRVFTGGGTPYKVFTPFARAWREHGWSEPAAAHRDLDLRTGTSDAEAERILEQAVAEVDGLPEAGEEAALRRWHHFLDHRLSGYAGARDQPAVEGTTGLSPHLKVGTIHPRTMLADIAAHPQADSEDAQRLVDELGWREFYADVLHHNPSSAWQDLKPLGTFYDDPADARGLVAAWREGRTGYPIVDAGMRQMLATGWMHNRVRMITASFFCKDLHQWWPHGARFFLDSLLDADLASNNHGWQWVAGTGTDASPYFRIFNPTSQGLRFDPSGDYVRRWVPELAGLSGRAAHEPWKHGGAPGYPEPTVDHAAERKESLARYEARSAT